MDDESIRCQGKDGKFLFEWNPALNTIGIVRKDMFYRVQLFQDRINGSYQVIEQHPKNEAVPNLENK